MLQCSHLHATGMGPCPFVGLPTDGQHVLSNVNTHACCPAGEALVPKHFTCALCKIRSVPPFSIPRTSCLFSGCTTSTCRVPMFLEPPWGCVSSAEMEAMAREARDDLVLGGGRSAIAARAAELAKEGNGNKVRWSASKDSDETFTVVYAGAVWYWFSWPAIRWFLEEFVSILQSRIGYRRVHHRRAPINHPVVSPISNGLVMLVWYLPNHLRAGVQVSLLLAAHDPTATLYINSVKVPAGAERRGTKIQPIKLQVRDLFQH